MKLRSLVLRNRGKMFSVSFRLKDENQNTIKELTKNYPFSTKLYNKIKENRDEIMKKLIEKFKDIDRSDREKLFNEFEKIIGINKDNLKHLTLKEIYEILTRFVQDTDSNTVYYGAVIMALGDAIDEIAKLIDEKGRESILDEDILGEGYCRLYDVYIYVEIPKYVEDATQIKIYSETK